MEEKIIEIINGLKKVKEKNKTIPMERVINKCKKEKIPFPTLLKNIHGKGLMCVIR